MPGTKMMGYMKGGDVKKKKKAKGYAMGGDIGDSMPGIEGLDKKFGKSVADGNKATGDAIAKRIKKAKDSEAKSMEGRDLTAKEKKAKADKKMDKNMRKAGKKAMGPSKKNNTTKSSPLDAPKPPMGGMGGAGAAKAAMMGGMGGAPKPPMGGMGGAPKPPMGGMGGAPGGMGAMMKPGMGAPKPPMPGMKKGGKVKKKAKTYKSGGKVRGAGIAKQGVRKCKMR